MTNKTPAHKKCKQEIKMLRKLLKLSTSCLRSSYGYVKEHEGQGTTKLVVLKVEKTLDLLREAGF